MVNQLVIPEYRQYIDWEAWGQTLICIKCQVPIIKLCTWQQGPIAKLLVQVSYHMCSRGDFQQETVPIVTLQMNQASRLRDSFQIRSVL